MTKYPIDTYAVQLEAGPTIGGRRAMISCRQNGTFRGWISFYDDAATSPVPSMDADGRISLAFPLGRFTQTLDLLRNEKPISLYFHSSTFAGLSTGSEPVGEAES